MARGDSKKSVAYEVAKGRGEYNHDTDTFAWVLVSDDYGSINANASVLNISTLSQVSVGGNYVGKTAIANVNWAQASNLVSLSGDNISFAADPSNPQTAKCLIVVNDTSPSDDVHTVFDLTDDGTTAVDLRNGFTFNFNAGGISRQTVNA